MRTASIMEKARKWVLLHGATGSGTEGVFVLRVILALLKEKEVAGEPTEKIIQTALFIQSHL